LIIHHSGPIPFRSRRDQDSLRPVDKHVSEIRMVPQQVEDGKGHYVAKGEWKLLGNEQDALRALEPVHREIRVVAGAGFEPATFGL
jgi:hypothetical protein